MHLTIPTDDLRKLLDANPEVMVKLQATACEKIAEELRRKVEARANPQAIADLSDRITAAVKQNMTSKWTFPENAKGEIRKLVGEFVTEGFNEVIASANARIQEMSLMAKSSLDRDFERRYAEFKTWAGEEVRKLARDEFVKTLQEVRGAI